MLDQKCQKGQLLDPSGSMKGHRWFGRKVQILTTSKLYPLCSIKSKPWGPKISPCWAKSCDPDPPKIYSPLNFLFL